MRLLFALIGLLGFSISATAAGEWLYYKEYPWVYDNLSKSWLYLTGMNGKIYAYNNSTQSWGEFGIVKTDAVLTSKQGQVVIDKIGSKYRFQNLEGLTSWVVSKSFWWDRWEIRTQYHDENTSWLSYGAFDNYPFEEDHESKTAYEIDEQGNYSLVHHILVDLLTYEDTEIISVEDGVVTLNSRDRDPDFILKDPNKTYFFFLSKDKAIEFLSEKILNDLGQEHEELVRNADLYGGFDVIQKIIPLKNGETSFLHYDYISDLSPLYDLTHIPELRLTGLFTVSQKKALEQNLFNTSITWPDQIIDDDAVENVQKLGFNQKELRRFTAFEYSFYSWAYLDGYSRTDATEIKSNDIFVQVEYIFDRGASILNALGRAKTFKSISDVYGTNNIYIWKILDSLVDPSIETFGSNDDSVDEIETKVAQAEERVAVIVDVESRIANGDLNYELAASILEASTSTDPPSTFSKTSMENQVTNIVKIVEIYGGDLDAVAQNDNLQGLLNSDIDEEEIAKRAYTIKHIEDMGLTGSAIDDIIAKLNDTETSEDDEPVDIDAVIADADQKIVQSIITGSTEFDEDTSDGGASSGDDYTTIDLGDYDLDDSVDKLQFVGTFVNDGISQVVSEEIFEIKEQLSLDLDNDIDRSKLTSAIKLGFTLDEIINETNFDYEFYSAAYATEGGDSFSGGLDIVQAKEAKSLGYEISQLDDLSKLVNNLENDDFYSVSTLEGKNLPLILEALGDADFTQDEALAIGGSSYTSQDLDSIHNLKQTGFAVDDILVLSPEDYTYYTQAYSEFIGEVRLSKDELVKAKANGFELNEISNLTLLVKNPENDGSYTVDSLQDKNLALIVEALELDSADFSQSDALAIGGSSYTSQDLDSIHNLKQVGFAVVDILGLSTEDFTFYTRAEIIVAKDSGATGFGLVRNNISDITPLAGLTNLTELYLGENNISDIAPLVGLTNLTDLGLGDNNISDITPLAGLTNLEWLYLDGNNISESQKAILEEALPNTTISWPDVIIDDELTRSAKTAKLEIFTDSLDWEAIFKSRNDYVHTNYSVIDDGFSTGDFRVSISAYDPNYPSIQTTSNTSVDIRNYRSDENGDGIYDILDPDIFYQGSFTGTESGTYYNNNSYLGNVVFETLFNATRSPGQTFLRAEIYATVTSSSIPEIQVGQSFSIDRDYYTLSWSGTLDYDSTSYQASFSDNQTKVEYSANSQITQTNESSITLNNFSLPNSLGTTTNTDISLTRKGDIFHKQFVSNGITYYFRVLDIED